MPVQFKDYYATLGVARTATDDELKKAFRKLARQHHPDVAKDKKSAEEKFKEINEAYEVLSDPVKRKKYDTLGAGWRDGGGGAPPPRRRPGRRAGGGSPGPQDREFHFGGTGFSDFFEQFFGGAARGDFREYGDDEAGFPHGAPGYRGDDVEGDILVTLDEVVTGTLRPISLQTVDPRTGREETQTFTVRIPPGAPDGKRIRVAGHGGPGAGGAPAGDLYLRVRYAAHPDFKVQEGDLYHDVELAPWEAALGAQVVVPGLTGAIKVKIPPGTNQGGKLRLRGQGLPQGKSGGRGDLYVVAQIQMPTVISDEERELWEKLQKLSAFRPREHA